MRFSLIYSACVTLIIFTGLPAYASIPNTDSPSTFLGPIARASFSNLYNNDTSYTIAAEGGPRNYRLTGSLGLRPFESQTLKASIEYLSQRIAYPYFSGNQDQWVTQGSVSASYQYNIDSLPVRTQFSLASYLEHTPSQTLSTDTGTFTTHGGTLSPYSDLKRVAGSTAFGLSPGISFDPWYGTQFGFNVNYDLVNYDTVYVSSKNKNGLGGSVSLKQTIVDNFDVRATAETHQPYNAYSASVAWTNIPFFGNWTFSINGGYTIGKNSLPDTSQFGIGFDYLMDQSHITSNTLREASDDFMEGTARGAVYLPQVLAVLDQQVSY